MFDVGVLSLYVAQLWRPLRLDQRRAVQDLRLWLVALMASVYPQPVNLGNPGEMTLLELAETVVDVTGSRSEIVYEALPQDDPKVRQPDITLAREVLEWQPEVELADGERARLGNRTLVPGMPVEVFLQTGRRTPLAYLVKPFMDYFARAFRES